VEGSSAVIVHTCPFLGVNAATITYGFQRLASRNSFDIVLVEVAYAAPPGSSPNWTLDEALDVIAVTQDLSHWAGAGVPYASSEEPGGILIEWYHDPVTRTQAYQSYIASGQYSEQEIFAADEDDIGTGYYCIGFERCFIETHSGCTDRSIMLVTACYSDDWWDQWHSSAHIGYDNTVGLADTGPVEANEISHRLAGDRGRESRSSGACDDSLTCITQGDQLLVLNPAVSEIHPAHGDSILCTGSGYAEPAGRDASEPGCSLAKTESGGSTGYFT